MQIKAIEVAKDKPRNSDREEREREREREAEREKERGGDRETEKDRKKRFKTRDKPLKTLWQRREGPHNLKLNVAKLPTTRVLIQVSGEYVVSTRVSMLSKYVEYLVISIGG